MALNSTEALTALSILSLAEQKTLVGRLGRDPELRTFNSGAHKAEASIAINRVGEKDKSDWFKVEVWDADGQQFIDTAKKGDLIEVVGRVKLEQWTDKQTGEPKWQWLIRAETWRVLRRAGEAPGAAPAAAARPAAPAAAPAWQTRDDGDDTALPF